MHEDYRLALKKKIDTLNDQAEKDQTAKVNALKESFIKEMKALKDQLFVFRN